jgi:ribosomal protein S1
MGLLAAQSLRASSLLAATCTNLVRHGTVGSSAGSLHAFSATASSVSAESSSAASTTAAASTSGRTAEDMIAQYNLSLPKLKDQVILAKVISSKKGFVLVDPGYYGFCSVRKQTLSLDQLHNASSVDLASRTSRNDVRPGDMLKFRVASLFSPYGEMHLEPLKTGGDVQATMVWDELKDAKAKNRKVKGRVLNACQGGYAVGVAGYVGLLPFQRASVDVVRKIGVLQDFYVTKVDDAQQLLLLSDTKSNREAPLEGDEKLYSNI